MAASEVTTILGKGSSFDGKLTFEGTVRIDGNFKGEIDTRGTLVIGKTAEVNAQVRAGNVVIEGQVHGEITAGESLEIHSSARVYGNLKTPSLMIEKGAIFEGNCAMESAGRSTRKDPPQVVAMPTGKKSDG